MDRRPRRPEPLPFPAWWTRFTGLPDPRTLAPQGDDARWVWEQMSAERRAAARRDSQRPTVADHPVHALVLADLQRQWLPGLGFWRRPWWLGLTAFLVASAAAGVAAGVRPAGSLLGLFGVYGVSFAVAATVERRRRAAIAANERLAADHRGGSPGAPDPPG
ncbi:hypothetical protein FTX61_01955 [Nitriliruptoraceae bacterium ZYF776]|nr:hypothetical protein [Profundirhabdus halotolerans]